MPQGTEPCSAAGSSPTTAVHLRIVFTPKPFRTYPHPMACSCATTGLTCKQTNTQPSSDCLLVAVLFSCSCVHTCDSEAPHSAISWPTPFCWLEVWEITELSDSNSSLQGNKYEKEARKQPREINAFGLSSWRGRIQDKQWVDEPDRS